ncbi:MAG: hypothetical protein WCP53_00330 [Verrucomicrobiota bacterium]
MPEKRDVDVIHDKLRRLLGQLRAVRLGTTGSDWFDENGSPDDEQYAAPQYDDWLDWDAPQDDAPQDAAPPVTAPPVTAPHHTAWQPEWMDPAYQASRAGTPRQLGADADDAPDTTNWTTEQWHAFYEAQRAKAGGGKGENRAARGEDHAARADQGAATKRSRLRAAFEAGRTRFLAPVQFTTPLSSIF